MRRIVFPLAMFVVAVWPAAALAQAKEPATPVEQVVLSGDVVVPRGRVVGQIVVFTGSAKVFGVVDGDVVVLDGPVLIKGQVSGEVIALDGSVKLAPTAQVGGGVTAGGDVNRAEGAQVGGAVRTDARFTLGGPLGALGALLPPIAIAVSILLAALTLLLLAPRGGDRVASAVATAPFASIGWGLLLALLVPVLGLLTAASVLGLPFGLALLLGAGLLWLAGQASISWAIGRLILPEPRSRLGAVLVGWLIGAVIGLVPFVNVVWWVLGSAVGLGAAVVAIWRARREEPAVPPARRERGGRHAAGRVVVPPSEVIVSDEPRESPPVPLVDD